MRRFFRNAGIIAAAEVVARLKGLLIFPILTRHLGAMDFGVWSQVSMVVLMLSPMVSLGSDNGLIRLLPGQPFARQYRKFVGWIWFVLGGCLAMAAVVEIGGGVFSRLFFASADYTQYMPLAAASLFATLLPNAARMWFRIQNAAGALATATITQALLGIVAILVAVVADADVYHVVLLMLIADLALGVVLLAFIVARNGLPSPDFSIIAPALRFGLPLLPAAYTMWALNWMDRIFLAQYHTLRDVGIYAAACGLGYAIIQVFVNPIWLLYPSSAAELHNTGDREGVDRLLHHTLWSIMVVSTPAIAGLWALDEPIIRLIAGPEFSAGAMVMAIIAVAYLMHMLASFGDVALGLAYRQSLATVSITLAAAVNLALNFLLIPTWGIFGAALATLGAFLVQFAISCGLAARHGAFVREWGLILRVIGAAVLMGLSVRYASSVFVMPDTTRLALFVPAGAVLYVGLMLAMQAFPPAFSSRIRAWIGLQRRRSP